MEEKKRKQRSKGKKRIGEKTPRNEILFYLIYSK